MTFISHAFSFLICGLFLISAASMGEKKVYSGTCVMLALAGLCALYGFGVLA